MGFTGALESLPHDAVRAASAQQSARAPGINPRHNQTTVKMLVF